MITIRKNLILRRPQSGRLEGRKAIIRREPGIVPLQAVLSGKPLIA
jgi:hypothetical protein